MIPFIVLGIIGLLLGVLLVVASKYLHVEEDNRIADVTQMLPGYNCGACGFPGCSGFATALVEKKSCVLSSCKPGKIDINFKPIIEYLQKDNDEFKDLKVK